MPLSEEALECRNVIYQTAEDGLSDTIKPRLLAAGADCTKVIVIDESRKELTLSDKRIEEAIIETNAQLLIIDPLQAYLGSGVDMHRANEIRPIFKNLSCVAERTGCAIVIIGHMNKAGGTKGLYRGLGYYSCC
nr:AAA family ATPase [Rubeoparvulum massiliense]